jgi:hypothetical protein
MEIVVTNQYGLIIFAVTVDENGMPKTLYQGINRAEAVSTYQKAIENPANAKKRVRFYNFRQVYDYVGEEKNKSAYPIKEYYDDTEVYQPANKDNIETIAVNNNHKLLAPNGKVSNLTAEQWHLVRTPEFKDWFGDWLKHPNRSSQVLDANGEPMVMFHGSNNYQYFTNPYPNYTVFFDPRMSRLEPRTVGGGIYFSNKWDVAAQFSIFNFVVECFINIRKPIKIDGDYSHIWDVIGEERINYGKNDGVIMYNTYDTLDGETDNENYVSDIVIARYSNQVKLADGRNTTFDKNDVDIRFEDGGKLHSSNIGEAKKLRKKHDAEILLAPNGKKSNLTPEQWHLVRTPEFKAWFGDWENEPANASKVVDENGEPLVCYHGTDIEFTKFSKTKARGKKNQSGIYLSDNKKVAKLYGNKVLECFVSIKKPFVKDCKGANYWDLYGSSDLEVTAQYNRAKKGITNNDGVIFYQIKDALERFSISELGNNYIPFNSTQIKLADGSNTTFDGSNPDIRYSDGGQTDDILYKLKKYIDDVELIDDEPLRYWGKYKIGDTITVRNIYRDLPQSQADPDMGEYVLKVVPIALTDHYIHGYVHNRDYFREDDYDNYQTELLNRLKNDFDSKNREPIIAVYNRYGYYTVVDGHHRLVVANELGRKSIFALVIDETDLLQSERVSSELPAYVSYQNAIRLYNQGYQKEIQKNRIDWMQNLLQFKPNNNYADGGELVTLKKAAFIELPKKYQITNSSRPYSSLDISRVKKGVVQLHSVHPKRITKIDDLPI